MADKKYRFTVQIRMCNADQTVEDVVFLQEIEANDAEALAKIVKPEWQKARKLEAKKDKETGDEWGCFIDCEEVVRISDGTSYFDDETIPQGPDVADQLLEILDAG
jgi:hypothetical protein